MDSNIANMMDCPVCLDTMDDPVSLNCGHSFCHTCISNLVRDKAVKCPMCNTVQKLPNGLASLNINFGMRDMINGMKAMQAQMGQMNLGGSSQL